MIAEVARLYVLAVLLWGAQGKVRAFAGFRETLEFWLGLRPSLSAPAAAATICLEGAFGLGLAWPDPAPRRIAMIGALILFSLFTLLITLTLARGRTLRCSCFGNSGDDLSPADILRNLSLIGAGIAWLVLPSVPGAEPGALLLAAALALLLAQIAVHSGLIARLFAR